MRITRIAIHQVDLPLKEASYSWSTQCFDAFDSTVLIIETDSGVTGVGEVCPWGRRTSRPTPRARGRGWPTSDGA